jgi:serine/threonine-protein kinase ATR
VTSAFHVTLPSTGSIGQVWPESQQFVALPHGLQKIVSSQTGAIYIGFVLLSSLINGTRQHKDHCTSSATFEQLQPWILDTCLALWQHFKQWTTGSDKRPFHDETMSAYLDVLREVALPIRGSGYGVSGSIKCSQGLVRGLSSLLEKPNLSILNQLQLATMLVRLRAIVNNMSDTASTAGRRRDTSTPVIVADLETSIAQLCHDRERFCDLVKDLQVDVTLSPLHYKANIYQSALCLWTKSDVWPTEVANMRQELCTDTSEAFTDLRISEDASAAMKTFRTLNISDDGDRPAKRRKTLPESSEPHPGTCYKQVKEVLKTPTEDSSDLKDLHNVIL